MKITERSTWVVAEFTGKELRVLDKDLSEKEALEKASELNKVGDYSYVAIPIIITTRSGKFAKFNRLYKWL